MSKRSKTKRLKPARINSNGATGTRDRSAEELLRALASEVGLARAISVLQDEHQRVQRLIGR